MICQFCQQAPQTTIHAINGDEITCSHCQVRFRIVDGKTTLISFENLKLNSKFYQIDLWFKYNETILSYWMFTDHGSAISSSLVLLKSFDSILDINPTNATQKLQTILTFL